ncbi:STAS domain-containing protein [Pseudonocardia kujensis]|uniref:STAS domain-containing protein n=1 Tax=Pseudonocardia kujensis TaxID=1128675 RepID=UPI001E5C73CB|nr:STAS domain-containing protein [Pseudonocardia kujensis]MCE0766916.1 STAS domain-containing protein [Pseudonocardia kujensis]
MCPAPDSAERAGTGPAPGLPPDLPEVAAWCGAAGAWERLDEPGSGIELFLCRAGERIRVLAVRGEIDAAEAAAFQDAAIDQVRTAKFLVVDLTGVRFLASRGLAALVRTQRAAEAVGTTVAVVTGGSRIVLRPMQVTGVDGQLHLVAALDDLARP